MRPQGLLARLVGRRVARDGAWVAAGQLMSAIFALGSIRIITELLPPNEFGQLTLLVGIAALALGLTASPRLQALLRYYPDASREGRVHALRRIGIQLITPLVAVAVGVIVIGWLVASSRLGQAWFTGLMIAALLVVDCFRSFELSMFNAARRQRGAALIYTSDALARPVMAIVTVLIFGRSADAALAGYVAGSALVLIFIRMTMRLEGLGPEIGEHRPDFAGRDLTDLAATIRRYALPLAPLAIFGWLSGMGDRYVIAGLLTIEDAGLYAAAYALASRPFLMLYGVIELTVRPILQNAIAAGDLKLVARVKRSFLLLVVSGAAFGVVGFALLSEVVAGLMLAVEYRMVAEFMPWIALGYALYMTSNVFSRFCYAFDGTQAVLTLTVAGSLTGLAVLVPAIHFGGLLGAAAAVPVRFAVELVLSSLLAGRAERKYLKGLHRN